MIHKYELINAYNFLILKLLLPSEIIFVSNPLACYYHLLSKIEIVTVTTNSEKIN